MIKKKPAAAPVVKRAAKSASDTLSKPTTKAAAKPARKITAKKIAASPDVASGTTAVSNEINKPAKKVSPAAPAVAIVTKSKAAAKSEAMPVKPVAVVPTAAPRSNGATDRSLLDLQERPRKPKLVRDSFTMPEAEYAALGEVKKACLKAGYEVKKSELLRVGVGLIRKMDIVALKDILAALPPLKAGRPKKS